MKDYPFGTSPFTVLLILSVFAVSLGSIHWQKESNERIRTLEQQVDGLREKIKRSN